SGAPSRQPAPNSSSIAAARVSGRATEKIVPVLKPAYCPPARPRRRWPGMSGQVWHVETAKEPGRHEFSKMVEAARHDATIGPIICEKVDRLCRNLRDNLPLDDLPPGTLSCNQS